MAAKSIFTKEIQEFIKNNVTGLRADELTNLVNSSFNTSYNENQIKSFKKFHKLKSGVNTTFKNGHTINTGRKYAEGRIPNFKGNTFNRLPIGSERIDKRGYIFIKIDNPDVWVRKHHYIWEQINGAIPKNHRLIFLNQDKSDVRIENLALISSKEQIFLNHNKRCFKDANLTKVGLLLSKLEIELADKKERKHINWGNVEKAEKLLQQGLSIEQVAEKLKVKPITVKNYIYFSNYKKRYEENMKK